MLLKKGYVVWVKPSETKEFGGVQWNERKVWLEMLDTKKRDRVWAVDKTKNLDYIFGEQKNLRLAISDVNFTIRNFKKKDGTYGVIYNINRYQLDGEELDNGEDIEEIDTKELIKEQVKEFERVSVIEESKKDEIDWFEGTK